MRLDLRLHELELGFDRLLREQIAIGVGLEHRRAGARLAELEQEDEADEEAVAESAKQRPAEFVRIRDELDQGIAFLADQDSLHQPHERIADGDADRDREHKPPHRVCFLPRRRGIDHVGDRQPETLGGDERVPEGARLLDVQDRRDRGVDRQDQSQGLPGHTAEPRKNGRPPRIVSSAGSCA